MTFDMPELMTGAGTLAILAVLGGAVALGIWGHPEALAHYATIATVAVPSLASLYAAYHWGATRQMQAGTAPADEPKAGA